MKYNIFFILGLTLFSCNQDAISKEKKLTENIKVISSSDNMEILGNWTMCSSFENGMIEQFNVCPTISFLANGSGSVGNSSMINCFNWTFEKGKLNIYKKDNSSSIMFSDTFYSARIYTKNNLTTLVISGIKNDSQFYLSK